MIAPVFLSASEPNPQRSPQYWNSRKLLNVREAVRAFCGHALAFYPVVFGGHPAITPLVQSVAERLAFDARLQAQGPESEAKHDTAVRDGEDQRRDDDADLPRVVQLQSGLFVDRKSSRGEIITEPLEKNGRFAERPKTGWRNESLLYMRYQMIGTSDTETLPFVLRYETDHWMRRYGAMLGAARQHRLTTRGFSAAIFIGGMEGVVREYRIFRSFHPDTPVFPIGSTGSACEELLDEVRHHFDADHLEELRTTTAYSLLMQKILPPPLLGASLAKRVGWREGPLPSFTVTDHSDPEKINLRYVDGVIQT